MVEKAYRSMTDEWNAHIAAERLFQLSQKLLDGQPVLHLYKSGPCSKAVLLKEDWR